jgi:hypothetical protein
MRRRDFLASTALPAFSLHAASSEPLQFSPSGALLSWKHAGSELVNRALAPEPLKVSIGSSPALACNSPAAARDIPGGKSFTYEFNSPVRLTVLHEVSLSKLATGATALRHRIRITARSPLSENVSLTLPVAVQLPSTRRSVLLPLISGIARIRDIAGLAQDDDYTWTLNGSPGPYRSQALAIPLVDEFSPASQLRLAFCSDSLFSTHIRLPFDTTPGRFACTWPLNPGMRESEERTFFVVPHAGALDEAMDQFYATSLAGVPAGPDWLHDVALIDYDYLSHGGKGWFEDIDAFTSWIPTADRPKAALALHGWFDLVGRYTYDPASNSLDKRWQAFPSADQPEFQAAVRASNPEVPYSWARTALTMKPTEMTIDDMHRRIRYAKERGFRVFLYFADGTGLCENTPGVFSPDKALTWGGWTGPDTRGRVCQQNPLHPGVRDFFKGYLAALLNEYGREVDGFIWDETFTIPRGAIGTAEHPGYAARAMMTLVGELTAMTTAYRKDLAFMASDVLSPGANRAPYCLMAHGTFQDTGCAPESWPVALFPNWRNVVWSCNWAPVKQLENTRYGCLTFDTPVSVSNGPFGEDIGVSEMPPAALATVKQLFDIRKRTPMRIRAIEEVRTLRYQGRPVTRDPAL